MIIAVLPAYNEEKALPPLLDRFAQLFEDHFPQSRIVVVDDGSTDSTGEVIRSYRRFPVNLIEHERNQGMGAALKTGLTRAIVDAEEDDIIVTMDSDNTHNPALVRRMAGLIEEGNDVIIASRFQPGARVLGLSPWRHFTSWGATWLFRILFPIPGVKDYTCGFRAYRAGLLKQALERWGNQFIVSSGFSCQVDLLLRLRQLNAVMNEVPLILRYDHKPGKSKMNVTKTIRETLVLAGKRWLEER